MAVVVNLRSDVWHLARGVWQHARARLRTRRRRRARSPDPCRLDAHLLRDIGLSPSDVANRPPPPAMPLPDRW